MIIKLEYHLKKKIIFFKYPDYKKKQWSWEFNSNENKNVPNVPRNKGHDDFDSAKVPPRTVLHLYDGKNYKKYINHYWVNYDGLGISSIRNPKNKKKHNKVASFKIRNR